MKLFFWVLIFFSFLNSFSQSINNFDYENISNPDSKNELSLFLKKEVPRKLLRKANFQPKKNNIVLSFSINKENKPYRILISAYRSKDLNEAIKNAFVNYPLEKLGLDVLNKRNRYYIQIISKKKSKIIFNCSSKVIVETPPICNSCEDLEYFEDLKNNLNIEVKKYFYANANFNLLNNTQQLNLTEEKDFELHLYQEVELFIQFSVSKTGDLINKKTKVPIVFKNEVSKILASYPIIKNPGTFNGVKNKAIHSFKIKFKKGEKPVFEDPVASYLEFTKPNLENELSVYFSKNLSEELINKTNLNRINNRLTLSFELDKKSSPFNIKTSARSNTINEEIISIFKKYPIQKINFADRRPFNRYIIQILSFTDGKVIVNASSLVGYERVPIFPGCENSKSISEVKKCFSKGVQKHFAKKFDANLPKNLGLSSGRLKILIYFKINKEGSVSYIKTKLNKNRLAIKAEVYSVMKLLPKMASIPMQNGKPVNINYTIPFTIVIQ